MAKNDVRVTDNPKLKQKLLSDGNFSLYLDYYLGRIGNKVQRKREFLKLTILGKPRTPIEREMNKQTIELAQKIRKEREQEMLAGTMGYRLQQDYRNINFLDFFQSYIDSYTKKDKRNVELAFRRFKDFLKETEEFSRFADYIKPGYINSEMVQTFTEYLQSRSRGEGAHTLFARFKKVVKYATEKGVFAKNPCNNITIKIDDTITKDILSLEEMKQLIATHYRGENPNIRRAFQFSLMTGVRFCDVKTLTFAAVDRGNRVLKFDQNKTRGHSKNSMVEIPLNDALLDLIGNPPAGAGDDVLIFPLPSYEMCLKALQHWTARAGIKKHVSWHVARHSAATAMLEAGANVVVVKSVLGHSSLKYTERYLRAIDERKRAAINSIDLGL